MSISITDKPITSSNQDLLKVNRYTQALTHFIQNSDTPITIGLQGEWGTGKTSLMYMLREELEKQQVATSWVNTWEYSMFRGASETTPAVLNGLVSKLKESCGDNWTLKDEAENKIKKIGRFFGAVSNQIIANQTGVDVKGAMSDSTNQAIGSVDIAEIKSDIAGLIEKLIQDPANPYKRVVFFVDDLDRINPTDAVEILEALKNIFDIPHSIFILAIDYEVVVKGLEGKFGKKTEENEREFRSFFDKIIQVPFSMPTGTYDIDHFLNDKMKQLGVSIENANRDHFTNVVRNTVGFNPRSLKRYLNSFSLLNNIRKSEEQSDGKDTGAQGEFMLFSLLGIQISYPKIFRLIAQNNDFLSWNHQYALRIGLDWEAINDQIKKLGDNEMTDEDWEKVVWGACQSDTYLKSRAFSILELLNLLRSFFKRQDELVEQLEQAMQFASITSVDDNQDARQAISKVGNKWLFSGLDAKHAHFVEQGVNAEGIAVWFAFWTKLDAVLPSIDGTINYAATTTSAKIKGVTKVYFDNPFKKHAGNRLAIWFPVRAEIEQLLNGYGVSDQSGLLDHPSGIRVTEGIFKQLGKEKSCAFVEQLVDIIVRQYV
jgi:hypothetical protein